MDAFVGKTLKNKVFAAISNNIKCRTINLLSLPLNNNNS